ncbi:hypothetical protein Q8791_01210 [Nocardiopsis sp. CT-R113]|uniref:AbiEi antitoxin C-terminal domain-containing protein n=1 Tax=Nocardiopsis codii TaxID=3065942 RepID=A0ABU7K0Q4_9ACTN|nr:hypothetical protein [Nocardiopsis sp. CT-R113]MEE2035840.1 hypothetical protein [Nocardiopsis sp. CT-R113]
MTVREIVLPDRSLLLRTLVPVLGLLSTTAVAGDITAAYVWGVDLYPYGVRPTRTRLHVSVPPGVSTVGAPVVAHRETLSPTDRTVVEGARVTTPARTAADLAARAPSVFVATARLDGFLSRGLVTGGDLARAARSPRAERSLRRLRSALTYSSALSRSPGESWARVLVLEAGLPPPVPQCPVSTGEGVFHADLGWPSQRVALEYDSLEFHSSPEALARDRVRYAAMRAEGWEVVSVSVYDLQKRPDRLLRRVLHTLTRRGWSCPPHRLSRVRERIDAYARRPPLMVGPRGF